MSGQCAHARTTDPATSHLAARGVNVAAHKRLVIRLLRDLGSATDKRLIAYAQRLGVAASPQSLRSRRKELADMGLVDVGGYTREQAGRGRWETVWLLTEEGKRLAGEVQRD